MAATRPTPVRQDRRAVFLSDSRRAVSPMLKRRGIMSNDRFKPGEEVPISGIYDIVGPRGGKIGTQVTSVEGEPFPPTPEAGQGFELDVPTRHKP